MIPQREQKVSVILTPKPLSISNSSDVFFAIAVSVPSPFGLA